ncbi:FxLYD domain-containing protein [Haloarcula nitratireducens]|uniref:FxLYD domain-containing protein n=1 Tax=Haloarcula nitratireducens TaxID=2487749 RepID=A0AAW4P613_9EURY|nr:FxLYD domain-containing protein [Halomicroarcula nitratireducens]MBX0293400.1 FxLYD domain-containing protein [Halomicroarcula nitratireducens]
MNRRKLLKATGATALGAAVTGCLGQDQGDGGDGGGGEPTNDGDDEVAEGGQDQDSWFNLKGEVSNDTAEQLKFTRVDLAQIAGGDEGSQSGNSSVFGTGNPVAAVNGVLQNTAARPYEDVQVTATLYDQNDPIGQFIDSTEARNKDALYAGNKWQFTIIFEGADVDKATRYTIKADGDLAEEGELGTGPGGNMTSGNATSIEGLNETETNTTGN